MDVLLLIFIFFFFFLKTINLQHRTRDDITGKEIETVTVLERALNFLLKEFARSIYNRWKIRGSLETDVKFVIILPTYFSENIQQLVYETAVKVYVRDKKKYINKILFYIECTHYIHLKYLKLCHKNSIK